MPKCNDWENAFFIGKLAEATGISREFITVRFLRTLKSGQHSGRFEIDAPGWKKTTFRLTTTVKDGLTKSWRFEKEE